MKDSLKKIAVLSTPLWCGYLFYLLWLLYDKIISRFSTPCMLWSVLRIYCPACGGTRAVRMLVEGHLWLSLRCNVLPLLGLVVGLLFWVELIYSVFKKTKKIIPRNGVFWFTVLGIFLVFSVLRNVFPALEPPV